MNVKSLYRIIIVLYLAGCAAISIFIAATGRDRLVLSLLSPLFLLIPVILEKIFRFKRNYPLYTILYVFIFFAYCVGTTLAVYLLSEFYDKIVHMFSGVMFAAVGAFIFELLSGRDFAKTAVEPVRGRAMYLSFAFFFSLSIGYIWEIYEFFYNKLTGADVQWVVKTGVGDTMLDMITCLIGAAAYVTVCAFMFKAANRGQT